MARFTLAAPWEVQKLIQKSRFLAKVAPVASEEEALAFLQRHRKPEATHNVYAYKLGPRSRFSDDGEPAGTAGRPVLQAIEAQSLDRVAVLVVRYFGGVKLGAGGLVRAYAGVAAEALRQAPKVPLVERVAVRLLVPFAQVGRAYGVLRGLEVAEAYAPEGVLLTFLVPHSQAEALVRAVGEATRGQARRM
ncbi:IMPACT family member in pol 5'region [Thermus sp. CCB_US3_UF1]|uniref:IMPACT family protein n=1 Tax=Thermus sp. CCB_US3_UF1 TaxID=1111069 RepID=UPI00023891D3|nr:YigZ family protein [Thermus sp. CCB_US3_UF1]AEV16473.1 IMPACT family member in pol 5'region [Thermus sp. CCB_US3_UF1]